MEISIPALAQVPPIRIVSFDKIQFPFARACLDLFFARNCGRDIAKSLKVDQAIDVITLGEPGDQFALVLPDASFEVIRRSDVEGAVAPAGQDIDVKVAIHNGLSLRGAERRGNPDPAPSGSPSSFAGLSEDRPPRHRGGARDDKGMSGVPTLRCHCEERSDEAIQIEHLLDRHPPSPGFRRTGRPAVAAGLAMTIVIEADDPQSAATDGLFEVEGLTYAGWSVLRLINGYGRYLRARKQATQSSVQEPPTPYTVAPDSLADTDDPFTDLAL